MRSYYIWKSHPGPQNIMDKRCFRSISILEEPLGIVITRYGAWTPSYEPFGHVVQLKVKRVL